MYKIMPLFLFGIIHLSTFSQTYVSGLISSDITWDPANNPYIITANTLVAENIKLTILPGTVVKFSTHSALQINGEINAIGNTSSRILFTSNDPNPASGDWDAIIFGATSAGTQMDGSWNYFSGHIFTYTDFEYGGYVQTGNIYSGFIEGNATVYVENCTFSNSASEGIYLNGNNNTSTGESHISTNQFNSCGLKFNSNYYPKRIVSNTIDGGGIAVQNGSGNALIKNNRITNTTYGIFVHVSDYTDVMNNIIQTKTSSVSTLYGITQNKYVNQNSYNIYGNIIIGNCVNRFASGVSNNLFIGNKNPITSDVYNSYLSTYANNQFIECENYSTQDYYPMIELDGSGYNASYQFTANLFDKNQVGSGMGLLQHRNNYNLNIGANNNNFIDNQATFLFKNLNPTSAVPATNNYWGTTSTGAINNLIYDWYDNASKSFVNYTPFLSSPDTIAPISRPINVQVIQTCGRPLLKWETNGEQDIKGYKIYYGAFNGYSFEYSLDIGDTSIFDTESLLSSDQIAVTVYDNLADGVDDLIEGHESWYRFIDLGVTSKTFDMASNLNTVFCEGDSLQLFTDSNYVSCVWSTLETTDSMYITTPGTYSATVIDTLGISYCDTISTEWENINLDLGTEISVQNGQPYYLDASTSSALFIDYLWQDGSTNSTILLDTATLCWVQVTTPLGCSFYDTVLVLFDLGVSENLLSPFIKSYPNPSKTVFSIELNQPYSNIQLVLSDINGKIMSEHTYLEQHMIQLNVEDLEEGIYFIQLNTPDNTTLLKLVKE